MCGGFAACACQEGKLRSQAGYHLGRLFTYVVLGTIAGFIGAAIDSANFFAGVQNLSAFIVGAGLLVFGLRALFWGTKANTQSWLPTLLSKLLGARIGRLLRGELEISPFKRSALIGSLTTLLPCGLLYAAVAIAAGSGSPILAALVMGTFWAGTLPIMTSGSFISALMVRSGMRYYPSIVAVLLIFAGVFSMYSHLGPSMFGIEGKPACHHHAGMH